MTAYHEIADLTLDGWGDEEQKVAEHLAFIGDVSLDDEPYQFDYLRFYVRKSDGVVLYATDSGCSCPMPFENARVSDLKETTLSRVEDLAREKAYGGDADSYGGRPVAEVLADVRNMIPRMKEAGAR